MNIANAETTRSADGAPYRRKIVQIEAKEDPALLGGLVAKVGDLVYDDSLRTQLRELRRNLGK